MYEKGRISSGQLFIIMLIYLTATSSNTNFDFVYGGQDGGISNLVVILPGLLTLYLFLKLQERHPRKILFEYTEDILGKWPGKFVSLLYVWFALEVAVMSSRQFSEFIVTVLTPELSEQVYIIGIVIVGAYAVYRGMEAIVRFAQIAFPFYLFLLIFVNILLIGQFKLDNVLPFLDRPMGEILFASYLQYVFPIGELIFFIGFFPYLKKDKRKAWLPYLAIVLSGLYLAYRVIVSIGVLGQGTSQISSYPYIAAIRFVKIGEFVERIDILFLGIYIMIILLEFIVVFYTLAHGVAHLTGMKSVSPLVIPLCFLIAGLGQGIIKDSLDLNIYITQIRSVTSPIFALLLPLLLLIVSRIRFGKVQDNSSDNAANNTGELAEGKATN
ncbi:hypothetical protein AM501_17110 [Aneurinibacillus migulanus]|uniref:Spore germination protein KB n=1 Tax=Aneurinibacillus migulanus TaxID=47500 RepID=A0A0D1XZU4_ANEMI|nr:endospore germination permease [Aneurinibacillus migulanus]KIV57558.1 hypothetical protein TS65_10105 [Aneurinibacillus migulanus]KIV60019.1 hypothetical protein TS64_00800 [Aneurinibacillus migulanus]KON94822.1 hypothetical protein AF333_04320 [Aneurinibacillus migulanus]KPD07219.1 hypothetical protein AM501_17110 [Aneurinibacillus migulanus]MCP1354764.1 spore germination protein [Aneurinibacillus migulanus]